MEKGQILFLKSILKCRNECDGWRYVKMRMILSQYKATPNLLYPTETIAAIDDKRVKQCYEAYLSGKGQISEVLVVRYEDCLYIYEGHEQVIAAAQLDSKELDVLEIDRKAIGFWADDATFLGTLRDVGITAIYDFEAAGGFRYKNFPSYYGEK